MTRVRRLRLLTELALDVVLFVAGGVLASSGRALDVVFGIMLMVGGAIAFYTDRAVWRRERR
jgi:hypothetical protein